MPHIRFQDFARIARGYEFFLFRSTLFSRDKTTPSSSSDFCQTELCNGTNRLSSRSSCICTHRTSHRLLPRREKHVRRCCATNCTMCCPSKTSAPVHHSDERGQYGSKARVARSVGCSECHISHPWAHSKSMSTQRRERVKHDGDGLTFGSS